MKHDAFSTPALTGIEDGGPGFDDARFTGSNDPIQFLTIGE
jgi:hypothetical protein